MGSSHRSFTMGRKKTPATANTAALEKVMMVMFELEHIAQHEYKYHTITRFDGISASFAGTMFPTTD